MKSNGKNCHRKLNRPCGPFLLICDISLKNRYDLEKISKENKIDQRVLQ